MPAFVVTSGCHVGVYPNWRNFQNAIRGANETVYYSRYNSLNMAHDVYNESFADVYVDGCCLNNGRCGPRAGVGIFWPNSEANNLCKKLKPEDRVRGPLTNQFAEIKAATTALIEANNKALPMVRINTDSKFVINCVNKWVDKWQKNGWRNAKGGEVVNRAELEELMFWVDDTPDVQWEYVPAHSGIEGNEWADEAAKHAAMSDDDDYQEYDYNDDSDC